MRQISLPTLCRFLSIKEFTYCLAMVYLPFQKLPKHAFSKSSCMSTEIKTEIDFMEPSCLDCFGIYVYCSEKEQLTPKATALACNFE